ncbi:hypothetical protein [Candidatus Odyssella acanthamoebae]|uniref:Uncharacterized protein n=1 Tax=Candidatus Odyssella acanthamoebae TaxID=91604 RepID=A0A077AZM4_9PROT|nr:hypothetical protein [Candidatus Paracaedibacter acanthamoebae]AIK96175.1 hypothetical protein ID47_04580 [Candidatus Paracaedibacter acanthamoebae]
MISNIQKFSLMGATLLLITGSIEALAMEYQYPSAPPYTSRPSCSKDLSYPNTVSLKNKTSRDTRPSDKNKRMKSENTENTVFKEKPEGIYTVSGDQFKLNSEEFRDEIELLLKKPEVKYVIIDTRDDYNRYGDEIIQDNIRLVKPLYQKTLGDSSLTEKQIYKLVWLPEKKVMDDLMNQMSFWPEEWLFSMKTYYNNSNLPS